MKISDLCNIIQDTVEVPITPLADDDAILKYCETWKFHEEQKQLNLKVLKQLFRMLPINKILFYVDCYQIHFTFIWLESTPIAIGPYCSEILTETDYKILVKQNHLQILPVDEVLTYRSNFLIIEEHQVVHIIQCLDKYASPEILARTSLYLDANIYKNKFIFDDSVSYKSYSILIQERYQKESELMENIRHGKRNEALKNWRELHKSVDYLKHTIGYTIENARISASVTRTMIRIAGIQAGLPADLSDKLTGESSAVIRKAKNIEEINHEHERLIQTYCDTIHTFRSKNYSSLVLSCIYHMEHLYQEEIIISDLATELDVSVNHLITQFRKETGLTPIQFLRNERMQHAAWLLASSNIPIQEICVSVGIPDSNYFAKLFHKEYLETPSDYRKKHKL